jgi:hypothetical protein
MRFVIQQKRWLIHRLREQARSHRGWASGFEVEDIPRHRFGDAPAGKSDTQKIKGGSEPARESGSSFNRNVG